MKRVLFATIFAASLTVAWSSALASSHSESPGRRGGQGCAAGSSTTSVQPVQVVRPGHTVQPANAR